MGRALLMIVLVLSVSLPLASARLGLQVRTPSDIPPSTAPVAGDSAQAKVLPYEDGIINVRAYGAVGDGLADDAAAINAAIEATEAGPGGYTWGTQGGTVYLPSGTYRITNTIVMRNNVRFVGAGRWNTTIIVDGDCNGITVPTRCQNWSLGYFTILARSEGDDIAAAGLHIDTGVRFFQVDDLTIGYPSSSLPQFDYGIRIIGAEGTAGTVSVMNGVWNNIIVHRARLYCLHSTGMNQNTWNGGLLTGWGVPAIARIGGRGNQFTRVSFEGNDIGVHVVGSDNHFDACWYEVKKSEFGNPVWCILVERVGTGYHERAANNLFTGGTYSSSLANGGFIKIIGGTNNTWMQPGIDASTGTLVRIEGTTAYHNSFYGGRVPWSRVISQENPNVNMFDCFSNRAEGMPERLRWLWHGVSSIDWQVGRDNNGLRVRTYCDLSTVIDSNTPGLYTTRDGGTAPFNNNGDLIIKPRSQSNSGVEIWTGKIPARRLRVAEDAAIFMVGVRPSSESDAAMPDNTIYFSTDANKLVYKDPNGVVNPLY